MNIRQRRVLASGIVAIFVAGLFFIPWRIENTKLIQWAPFYRAPIAQYRSYEYEQGSTHMSYARGKVAPDVFLLELVAIAVSTGAAFVHYSDRNEG